MFFIVVPLVGSTHNFLHLCLPLRSFSPCSFLANKAFFTFTLFYFSDFSSYRYLSIFHLPLHGPGCLSFFRLTFFMFLFFSFNIIIIFRFFYVGGLLFSIFSLFPHLFILLILSNLSSILALLSCRLFLVLDILQFASYLIIDGPEFLCFLLINYIRFIAVLCCYASPLYLLLRVSCLIFLVLFVFCKNITIFYNS